MKKIFKRISNYFKTTDKNYSSEFTNDDIQCSIVLGSCTCAEEDTRIRDMIDHVIIRFDYPKSMIKDKNEFIQCCCKHNNVNIHCIPSENKETLFISGNSFSIMGIILDMYNNDYLENAFATACNNEILMYADNRDESITPNTPSFDYVISTHKNIKKEPCISSNYYLEILGYTKYSIDKEVVNHLNCIWIDVDIQFLYEFSCMPIISYRSSENHSTIKINLSDFITAINDKYVSTDIREILIRVMNTDKIYYKYILDQIVNSEDIENDIPSEEEEEEEREITQEDFFNAALDQIIGR